MTDMLDDLIAEKLMGGRKAAYSRDWAEASLVLKVVRGWTSTKREEYEEELVAVIRDRLHFRILQKSVILHVEPVDICRAAMSLAGNSHGSLPLNL